MTSRPAAIGDSEFDTATAVEAIDGDRSRFAINLDAGWTVGPRPNGGYLLAAVARAAGQALAGSGSTHRDPLAATAHYLHAPDIGQAEVRTEVLRTGRGASQVRASLWQGERPCVDAAFTIGSIADGTEPWWSDLEPPPIPAPDDCVRLPAAREGALFVVPIMDRLHLRLDPATLGFARGEPSGRAEIRGWFAFGDGRPLDAVGLLFALDALPPATFELVSTGWVPTLSLTTYVRARPSRGPVLIRQRAQVVEAGRVDEVCDIWDASGRLVGQATQLAGIRIPDGARPVG